MEKEFYVQDTRTIVGNSATWWAIGGRGYTCDIRCAQVWKESELAQLSRETDKPWPKEIIDRYVQHHIDVQDLAYGPKSDQPIFQRYPHTLVSHRPDLCT